MSHRKTMAAYETDLYRFVESIKKATRINLMDINNISIKSFLY